MSEDSKAKNAIIASFPTTKQELAARRLNARYTNVNDVMDMHFWDFLADDGVGKYLEPLYNADAVTGMVKIDHNFAAARILELAEEKGIHEVAALNVRDCTRVLHTVMKRYELMPWQRIAALEAADAAEA